MGEAVGEIILANQCGWLAVDSANPRNASPGPTWRSPSQPAQSHGRLWLLVALELAVPCWPTSRNLLSSATPPELTIGTDCTTFPSICLKMLGSFHSRGACVARCFLLSASFDKALQVKIDLRSILKLPETWYFLPGRIRVTLSIACQCKMERCCLQN